MKLLRAYAMSLHGKSAHLMSETNDVCTLCTLRNIRTPRAFFCFAFFCLFVFFFHFDTFPRCVDVSTAER